MMIKAISAFAPLAGLACALAACSPPTTSRQQDAAPAPGRAFSAEERRIAQALSISGTEKVEGESQRDQAAKCVLALDAIEERVRDAELLTATQRSALNQARRIYAQRLQEPGGAAETGDAIMARAEEQLPDQASRMKLAVSCLRGLPATPPA